jgi:hypothetical protein
LNEDNHAPRAEEDRHRPGRWADRLTLLEAGSALILSGLAAGILPFAWVARLLRMSRTDSSESAQAPLMKREARRVRWAIHQAAARSPFPFVCLARSLAARIMLWRRGVPSTLRLGVRKAECGSLDAHAWLIAAGVCVSGDGQESFAEVGRFD